MRYEAVTNLMAVVTVSHELFLYANLVANSHASFQKKKKSMD